MIRTLNPTGPDFEPPDGRLYGVGPYHVLAYGRTGSDEVVVRRRIFNTTISIGPAGAQWYREHW